MAVRGDLLAWLRAVPEVAFGDLAPGAAVVVQDDRRAAIVLGVAVADGVDTVS